MEPTYYAVHELDLLPELRAAPEAASLPVAGSADLRLRLELLIGADGTVRRVVVLSATAPQTQAAAAHAYWMSAQFDPARKAGRAVASIIELEVGYESSGRFR